MASFFLVPTVFTTYVKQYCHFRSIKGLKRPTEFVMDTIITWPSYQRICNGNRSDWSSIRSVIIRVIAKSDDREAGVRFVYHEYD